MCDGIYQYYENKLVHTRKAHRCYECGFEIPVGSKVRRFKGLMDGEWDSAITCQMCDAIWDVIERKNLTDHLCHGGILDYAYELSIDFMDTFLLFDSAAEDTMKETKVA